MNGSEAACCGEEVTEYHCSVCDLVRHERMGIVVSFQKSPALELAMLLELPK